jgi:hypothetical protein
VAHEQETVLVPGFGSALAVASDEDAPVWVVDLRGLMLGLDRLTGVTVATIPLDGRNPRFVLAEADRVWVSLPMDHLVRNVVGSRTGTYTTIAIDPSLGELSEGYGSLAIDGSTLWVVTSTGLVAFDSETRAMTGRIELPDVAQVAVTGDQLWVWQLIPLVGDRLIEIGPDGQPATTLDTGAGVASIRGSDDGIWVSRSDGRVVFLDRTTKELSSTDPPASFAASTGYRTTEGPDGVWSWQSRSGSADEPFISRIDPTTFEAVERITIPDPSLSGRETTTGPGGFPEIPDFVDSVVNTEHVLWVLTTNGRLVRVAL